MGYRQKASQTNQRYLPPINESQAMKDKKGNICLHHFQEQKSRKMRFVQLFCLLPYMLPCPLLLSEIIHPPFYHSSSVM
jgi:hypothetical protein